MVRTHADRMSSRLYFYAGGKEGDTMLPDMKRILKEMKQYSTSNVKEVIDPGAQHNEAGENISLNFMNG